MEIISQNELNRDKKRAILKWFCEMLLRKILLILSQLDFVRLVQFYRKIRQWNNNNQSGKDVVILLFWIPSMEDLTLLDDSEIGIDKTPCRCLINMHPRPRRYIESSNNIEVQTSHCRGD
ncbi:hypothetical protein CEXT_337851 [Caerostris extrusa]|uniref:Uncharacterized protein n=1 Tax=Caerostris extrusa TaxID=172846 RepID=A0AAV4T9D4_CAEEX|nr:hypothetical protein CEXT_337851 [Caerostris extrusa]